MNEDKIIQKLTEHDKRFDEHDKRFDEHDKRFDVIVGKLMEHDKKFDRMENKFDGLSQKVLTAQDEIMTVLRRLDQERIFTTAWVGRIEKEVEEHTREIKNIKQALKI